MKKIEATMKKTVKMKDFKTGYQSVLRLQIT